MCPGSAGVHTWDRVPEVALLIHSNHVAEILHKIDPIINIVEMWPKIYVLRPEPTRQRGKRKEDKEKLLFRRANAGIISQSS